MNLAESLKQSRKLKLRFLRADIFNNIIVESDITINAMWIRLECKHLIAGNFTLTSTCTLDTNLDYVYEKMLLKYRYAIVDIIRQKDLNDVYEKL